MNICLIWIFEFAILGLNNTNKLFNRLNIKLKTSKCFTPMTWKGQTEIDKLKKDLDVVGDWCKTWGMRLNLEKCKGNAFLEI